MGGCRAVGKGVGEGARYSCGHFICHFFLFTGGKWGHWQRRRRSPSPGAIGGRSGLLCVQMAAPSLTLMYFNIHGLAARIRIACAVGGVVFRDHRFADRAEFTALKTAGELPFGQVPCLVIEKDGATTKLAQSSAILRYVCQLGGLYPACPLAASVVDASLAAEADAFASFTAISYPARNGLDHLDAAAIEKAFESQRAEVIVSEGAPAGLRIRFPLSLTHTRRTTTPGAFAAAPLWLPGTLARGQRHGVGVLHPRPLSSGFCVGDAPLRRAHRRCGPFGSRGVGALSAH